MVAPATVSARPDWRTEFGEVGTAAVDTSLKHNGRVRPEMKRDGSKACRARAASDGVPVPPKRVVPAPTIILVAHA